MKKLKTFKNQILSKKDLGAISAFAIKEFRSSQAKIGIALIKIGFFEKKLEYQVELDKIEKEMKQNYPDNYENKFHPMYKFSGGGVTASW